MRLFTLVQHEFEKSGITKAELADRLGKGADSKLHRAELTFPRGHCSRKITGNIFERLRRLLCEGNSTRAVTRLTGTSRTALPSQRRRSRVLALLFWRRLSIFDLAARNVDHEFSELGGTARTFGALDQWSNPSSQYTNALHSSGK